MSDSSRQTHSTTSDSEAKHPRAAAPGAAPSVRVHPILKLQRTIGNRAVQRLLTPPRIQREWALEPPAEVTEQEPLTDEQVARAIRYNNASYDADSINLIQDLVGTAQTGTFNEETVRAVADVQARYALQADGKVGPNTFDLLTRELSAEGADPSQSLLLFQIDGPEPLAFFRNTPTTGTIGSRFYIHARFDPRANPADFEYRQYIRGNVVLHDVASPTPIPVNNQFAIPGGGLDAGWKEDGDTTIAEGTAGHHYGHRRYRANPSDDRDEYLPDRRTGNEYAGHDFPELGPIPAAPGDSGDRYEWEMYFRGVIVHKTRGVVSEKYWAIRGTITIP